MRTSPFEENENKIKLVYDTVRYQALIGKLDGKVITENGLAEDFGVKRGVVRKALLRLRNEGILDATKKLGTHVKQHTPEEIIDHQNLRLGLEIVAVRLASEVITSDQLNILRSLNQAGREADENVYSAKTMKQMREYEIVALDAECRFHLALVSFSGNEMLFEAYQRFNIHPISNIDLNKFVSDSVYREQTIAGNIRTKDDHDNIIDALEKRDSDLSEMLIRKHIGLKIKKFEKKAQENGFEEVWNNFESLV